jgi:hypothetical protein
MDRHNVELTRTVFGTGSDPDDIEQVYVVFRHNSRSVVATSALIGEALSKLMVLARYTDLGTWVS